MNSDSLSAVVEKGGTLRPLEHVEVQVQPEEDFGVRNPRKLPDPKMPSKEEVERHYLTHLPFRSWCQYCIQGKDKTAPRFQQEQRGDGLMEVHVDYCFMSTHGSPMCTILVAKEKSSKMTLATVVPMKGTSMEYPIVRTLTFLKEIGIEGADIVLKPDQENAIKDLLNKVAARRSAKSKMEKTDGPPADPQSCQPCGQEAVGRTIHESSPVGSSQSNGFIERAIQAVEGQIRTMKLDFESHIGEKIPSDHNLIPWLVEYSAVLVNRGQVGKDGKTAYERLKGKPASLPECSLVRKCYGGRTSRPGTGETGWTLRLRRAFT